MLRVTNIPRLQAEDFYQERSTQIIPPARPMELERIRGLLSKAQDIREDAVADLKTQILNGGYRIKASQVAEKIIEHGIYVLGTRGNSDYTTI